MDLLLELGRAFSQLRLLPAPRLRAKTEQFALAFKNVSNLKVICLPPEEIGRKANGLSSDLFRFETRLARIKLVKTLGEDGQIRLGLCPVETHHHVTGIDALVVTHAKLSNDASGWMLDLFNIRIDDYDAMGNYCAGKLGGAGPTGDAGNQGAGHERGGQEVTTDGAAARIWSSSHALRAPSLLTTVSGDVMADRSTVLSILSRGPKACWRPWFKTRT